MTRLRPLIAAAILAAAALPATASAAKPPVCTRSVIQQALIDAGKLTQEDVANGEVVDLVRCGDVLQPHYDANDPNCCPSSFRMRRYTWTGSRFKAGRTKKLQSAPARFYRP